MLYPGVRCGGVKLVRRVQITVGKIATGGNKRSGKALADKTSFKLPEHMRLLPFWHSS
jgi:hypothetical protein